MIELASGNVAETLVKPTEISKDNMVKAFQWLYLFCKIIYPTPPILRSCLTSKLNWGWKLKLKYCKGSNAQYTSRTAIREYLECLSDVIEIPDLDGLRSSDNYSLMFDEATDVQYCKSTCDSLWIHRSCQR